jgi:hypothetical protein
MPRMRAARALAWFPIVAAIAGGCGGGSSSGSPDATSGDAAADAKSEAAADATSDAAADATSDVAADAKTEAASDATADVGPLDSSSSGGGEAGGCTNDNQCPSNFRCCYPCGIPGCANACLQTDGGPCPAFP